ncbi:hypothetical protein GCM10022395_27910 [Snuella lapsa]|uniref:Uncharacterized protein n=1 Tax=Snuella lapsa TaxID=870481 RepID=A0ABP6Y559_9FLAO
MEKYVEHVSTTLEALLVKKLELRKKDVNKLLLYKQAMKSLGNLPRLFLLTKVNKHTS